MPDSNAFTGTTPEFYDRYLGPFLMAGFAADLAARVTMAQGLNVLEVACGSGLVTKALAKTLGEGSKIVATDLSPEMIQYAARHFTEPKTNSEIKVEFLPADGCELPFKDAEFDVVICQFGLMFFPDKVKGAQEARRVLKPGGTYLFSVWGPLEENSWGQALEVAMASAFPTEEGPFLPTPFSLSDDAELRTIIEEAGFSSISIEKVQRMSPPTSTEDLTLGFTGGTLIAKYIQEQRADLEQVRRVINQSLKQQLGDPTQSKLTVWVGRATL